MKASPVIALLCAVATVPLFGQAGKAVEQDPAYVNVDQILDLADVQPEVNINLPHFLLANVTADLSKTQPEIDDVIKDVKQVRVIVIPRKGLAPQLQALKDSLPDDATLQSQVDQAMVAIQQARKDLEAQQGTLNGLRATLGKQADLKPRLADLDKALQATQRFDKSLATLRQKLDSEWLAIVRVPEDGVGIYVKSDAEGNQLAGMALLVSDDNEVVFANLVGNVPLGKVMNLASKMDGNGLKGLMEKFGGASGGPPKAPEAPDAPETPEAAAPQAPSTGSK